ncbi:uncharacterized protein K441DRAFT_663041 [Cenococcum geophilum 1.58]|uniref:uncharacterized protein n=1 Tax=Cenococcum geophilum 1.58 TaxID=794803 RepID=UPI00358ED3FF|nr:hypothetical protein K441DRAFT_663041 [Cenococcum geophilum 1.58]
MASNASDDGQTNTSILSTARSDPIAPTDLQRVSDHSLDEEYKGIKWKRLLGYHIPHLTAGGRRGPMGS